MSVNNNQYSTYLYFILVLGLTSLLLFLSLRVRKVDCYQSDANPQELQKVCQDINSAFINKSLLFYNFYETNIWQELAQKADYQQLYYLLSLEKVPPGNLIVNLASKLPDYRLIIFNEKQEEQAFILNQNNYLKKDFGQNELFTIFYQGQEKIFSKNDQYLSEDYHQFFLAIKTNLEYYQIGAKNLIWQKNNVLELDLGKSWTVILDKDINPQEAIKKLALILQDEEVLAEIEKQGVLDLRFNLPVIREQF